jgi:CrcB protein
VSWVLVALGAAVGAALRYVAGHVVDGVFPRGTILVNWVGSFLLGAFSGLGITGHELALLGAGFCGGLTTYSTFVVQAHDRGPRVGTAVVVVTIVPALLLCGLGFWLGGSAG